MEQTKEMDKSMIELLEENVWQYVNEQHMLVADERVLVGVSGGADSVCLLFMLMKLRERMQGRLQIRVVHVHHMLRGLAADADLAFVQQLCQEWEISFEAVYCPVQELAKEQGLSLEEAGRIARYEAMERICQEQQCDKIAVAHHQDDQAETVLMNLFRGTGITGMAGIRPMRGRIIRPLLCMSRKQIENYLQLRGITYCIDETNLETEYTRNKIRNQLLPFVTEQINDRAVEHVVRFASHAEEIDCYFQNIAKNLFATYGNIEENGVILCVDCLQEERMVVMYLIRYALGKLGGGLKDVTQDHLDKIYQLMAGRTGSRISLPGGRIVEKSYERIRFCREGNKEEHAGEAVTIVGLQEGKAQHVHFLGEEYTILLREKKKNETFPKKKYTKCFDYDKIESMLQLRTRMSGDMLTVHADGGSKKLKDYFIDAKIPREDRDKTALLADGSQIIWIVGQRISERYKVQETTKWILEVACISDRESRFT